MNTSDAALLFEKLTQKKVDSVERCGVGTGNFVFVVDADDGKYILRCNTEDNAYKDTVYWLKLLKNCSVPVPQIILSGVYGQYSFLILNYMPGDDIGKIYKNLSDSEKRSIAHEVIVIQNRVSKLKVSVESDWSWNTFIKEMLCRAEMRISKNGYFDVAKVSQVHSIAEGLSGYFASIKPIPYLDDISTKNLLIENGKVSGIIDVDWIGIGDMLTFVVRGFEIYLKMPIIMGTF